MPMLMPEKVRRTNILRTILLILSLLSLPFACMGFSTLAFAMPGMDIGIFQAEVRVENNTDETLYITPITTTYTEPRVIQQPLTLRQRDHLLRPGNSMRLTYDMADFPLAGIIVCRESDVCRLADNTWDETLIIDNFNSLLVAEQSWLAAIERTGLYNFTPFIYALFALLPLIFFGVRWRLGKELEKTYS